MKDELVILEITDGTANTSIVHHPAAHRQTGHGGPRLRFTDYDWAPNVWTSACGLHGAVYNHAGLLQDAPICQDCQIAVLSAEA